MADSGHPGFGTDEVRLRDGTRLVVRPIAPDDEDALVRCTPGCRPAQFLRDFLKEFRQSIVRVLTVLSRQG